VAKAKATKRKMPAVVELGVAWPKEISPAQRKALRKIFQGTTTAVLNTSVRVADKLK